MVVAWNFLCRVHGWQGVLDVVDTCFRVSQLQTLSGRGARVYTCTCVHDNIPCIDVYRSRPIGASLLCLALNGLHMGWLGMVMASGIMWPQVALF